MTRKSKKQIQNQAQDGRSMVEMLGVLAIIAVVSIGGIVGYKLAMNHYQASQIAHEMNIMRTDAQIKIAQGTEKLTLGSPYDEHKINFNGYETAFGCKYVDENDFISEETVSCQIANAYFIELPKIPDGVCQPLARLINGMDNLIAFSVNDSEYEEGGTCREGENDLYAVFSGETVSDLTHCERDDDCDELESTPICDLSRRVCVECTEEKGCEGEEHCENNVCKTCDSGVWDDESKECVECLTYENCTDKPETPQCDETSHTCKSCAEIDSSKPLWYNNKCVECVTYEDCKDTPDTPNCNTENTCAECPSNSFWDGEKCQEGCRENNHCAEDEYCYKLGGFSCTDEWKDEEDFSGSCRKVNEDLIPGTVNGQIYYGSKNTMNWWSAERFCKAAAQFGHGNGQMAVWGKPNFNCNPPVTLSTLAHQYCHKNGSDVRVGDFNDLSTTVEELREMFGVTHTGEWDTETIDIWLDEASIDCHMFEVEISTTQNSKGYKAGFIQGGALKQGDMGNHALCQP